MHNTRLSVLIYNYNRAYYIRQSLESVMEQSFKPAEIIVVDDGSTDESTNIIKQFTQQYPLIQVLQDKMRAGSVSSVNRALKRASGDYVYVTGSENMLLPDFFESSMNQLEQHPGAGLCCSEPAKFDDTKDKIIENRNLWSNAPRFFLPNDLVECIQSDGYISSHTCIVKLKYLLEMGGFRPELKWYSDWFAMLTIGFRYGICYIPKTLAVLRDRPDSYSVLGKQVWSLQSQVLNQLMHVLKSSAFQDVLSLFICSDSLSYFGTEIARVVMSNPEHWDSESQLLCKKHIFIPDQTSQRQRDERIENSIRAELDDKVSAALVRGIHAILQTKWDEAISIFMELEHEVPNQKYWYAVLAAAVLNQENQQEACDALNRAVKLFPASPELHNLSGVANLHLGKLDRAEQAFQQTLILNPNIVDARRGLADIVRLKGRRAEAIERYQQVLRVHPNDVESWLALGRLAVEMKNIEQAHSAFQQVLALDPSREDVRQVLEKIQHFK